MLDLVVFGQTDPGTHEAIDKPVVDLGFWHRLVFHSPADILASDPELRKYLLLHQLADLFLSPAWPLFEKEKPSEDPVEFVLRPLMKPPEEVLKWFGSFGIRTTKK